MAAGAFPGFDTDLATPDGTPERLIVGKFNCVIVLAK
jgi:hypothetical protein